MSRVLGAQVDLEAVLVKLGAIGLDSDREASKLGELSLVLVVFPEVNFLVKFLARALNLKNVIADANDSILDVAPVADKLGTNMDIKTKSIGKVLVLCKHKVALSMVFEVLVFPGLD